MLHKTTLYLPLADIEAIKSLAISSPKRSLTYHITQAVKLYLKLRKDSPPTRNAWLKCKGSAKRGAFGGDSVQAVRSLRDEWER